jgi:predicted nucleic acid-binding protein
MIVVDTSVWIAASRQPRLAKTLQQLLEADEVTMASPVRMELLAGVATEQRAAFKLGLRSVPLAYPTEETWRELLPTVERAADRGERFGLADLLIAALANELGGLVWSLDKDFERMERLGLVSLYQPPDTH